jgi:branched-chain amino acid transport system permease protein
MAELLEQVINGLILGGIYALIAVGYTMVYGIIQLINFAHGEIFMFGAYFAFLCVTTFGLPFWVALPISMLLCATMGMLIDFIAYRPLRNAPRLSALITAIGISLVLQNLARMIWGAEWRVFPSATIPTFLTENSIPLPGGAQLLFRDMFILVLAVILMVGLNLIIYLTKIGKAMRACAQDKVAAHLMGINTNWVILVTFAIGSALGAVAGVMVGVREVIEPTMGYYKGVAAFAAAVLGGIGNITGAMLGGLLLGIAETLGAGYISSGYRLAIAYIIMILVIIFRPSGLLGKSTGTRA